MTPVLDPKKVAETNPAVDAKKLEQVRQIRQLLEAAGVSIKAEYRLAPALQPGRNKATGKVLRLAR